MKKYLLSVIIPIIVNTGYSQSNTAPNPDIRTPRLGIGVYYLSSHGAVSDAQIGMNSVTFGTDNTAIIQSVLDKAKNAPVTVYWDGRYSVTGLKIYSNTTIIANAGCVAIL